MLVDFLKLRQYYIYALSADESQSLLRAFLVLQEK